MKRTLTTTSAASIREGLSTLLAGHRIQGDKFRRFAEEIVVRLDDLLSGGGETVVADWEPWEWGDLSYLLGAYADLGLRRLAADLATGVRMIPEQKQWRA